MGIALDEGWKGLELAGRPDPQPLLVETDFTRLQAQAVAIRRVLAGLSLGRDLEENPASRSVARFGGHASGQQQDFAGAGQHRERRFRSLDKDQLERCGHQAGQRGVGGHQRGLAGHHRGGKLARAEHALGAQLVPATKPVATPFNVQPGIREAKDKGTVSRGKETVYALAAGAGG